MKKRILSIVIAMAMILSLTATATASEAAPPRTIDLGFFTIGFFDSNQIFEVRLNEEVAGGMVFRTDNLMYTRSGITRVRNPKANDEIEGTGAATMIDAEEITFLGFTHIDTVVDAGTALIFIQVDGTGSITLNGAIVYEFGDDDENIVPINIELTNRWSVEVSSDCCDGDCLIGDVDNNGVVSIIDALEILKYLAGIDGILDNSNAAVNHALILPSSRENGSPVIGDVLEILKALADIPSIVTRLSR
jgi:hypothetical protein